MAEADGKAKNGEKQDSASMVETGPPAQEDEERYRNRKKGRRKKGGRRRLCNDQAGIPVKAISSR
jgi:hypothetical protein